MKSYIEHIVFWTAAVKLEMQRARVVGLLSFMQLIIGETWQEQRHLSVKAAAEHSALPAALMTTDAFGVGYFL